MNSIKVRKEYIVVVITILVVSAVSVQIYFNSPQYTLLQFLHCLGQHDIECIKSFIVVDGNMKQFIPPEGSTPIDFDITSIVIENISYTDAEHVSLLVNFTISNEDRQCPITIIFDLTFNETWKISNSRPILTCNSRSSYNSEIVTGGAFFDVS